MEAEVKVELDNKKLTVSVRIERLQSLLGETLVSQAKVLGVKEDVAIQESASLLLDSIEQGLDIAVDLARCILDHSEEIRERL